MKFKIVVDSGANLQTNESKSIVSVPLTIRTAEKEFVDNDALNVEEMTDYLASYKGQSGSACPSSGNYLDAFGDADRIFVITITSNLSGSYNAARVAKEQYEEEHPGRKVFLIDSLSAGPELKLIVEKIQEYVASRISFEDICKKISSYREKTNLVFCLKSLTNLANNGRVNPAVAKLAGVLNIRVAGIASQQGDLEQKEKARGDKKAIATIQKIMLEKGYTGGKVRIDHCFNEEDANRLKELILSAFPGADVILSKTTGLCSFYAERGGLLIGFES